MLNTELASPRSGPRTATATRAVALAVAALVCHAAQATEYGSVVSSTPVTAQVPVPQTQCRQEQQVVQPRTGGGGAVVGAIIGGVLGNSVGGGFGRAAATGLGVVTGAAVGDRVEASNNPPVATTVQHCTNVTAYENRVIGYDVVYDYNGVRRLARLAQAPGDRIEVNVAVSPAGEQVSTVAAPLPPPVRYVAAPPPPTYVYPPAYPYYGYGRPAVVVAPRLVYGGGYWRHGDWR